MAKSGRAEVDEATSDMVRTGVPGPRWVIRALRASPNPLDGVEAIANYPALFQL